MKVEHHQPTPKSGSKPRALGPVVPCVLERRPNNQRSRVSEEDALGVVLIAAAALGVLVSARTLLLAWFAGDRILALIAVAALVVSGIAVLVAAEGIL